MESTNNTLTLRADLVHQQHHLKEVVSLANQQDTDMVIVSKDKQLLSCNKSLLALFSPVVARLLSGVPCCSSPTIFLPDFPALPIRKLLHLLRSGHAIPGENVKLDIRMINRITEVLQISMSDLNLGPYLENPLEASFEIKKEFNSFTVKEEIASFKEEKKDEVLHVKQEKENYNEKVEPMSVKQEEIAEQCEYIEEDDRNIDIKDESAPLLSNRSTVLTLDENYEKVMAIEEKQKEIDDMLSRMEVLKQEYMGDTGSHEEIKDKLLNETLIETTCPHSGSSVNTAPHLSSRWVGGSRPDIPLSTAAPSGSRIRQAPPSRIEGLADEVGVRGWQRLQIKEDPQEAKKFSYQKSSEPKRDPSKKDSSKASSSGGGGSSGRSRLRSPSEFMRQDRGRGDGGGRSNRNNNGGGGRARNNNNGGKGGGGARKRHRERSPSGSPTHESKRHRSRSKDNARDGYQDRRRSSGGGGGRNNDKDRSGGGSKKKGGRNRKDKVSLWDFLPPGVRPLRQLQDACGQEMGQLLLDQRRDGWGRFSHEVLAPAFLHLTPSSPSQHPEAHEAGRSG